MADLLADALKTIGQSNAVAQNRRNYAKVFPTGLRKFDTQVLGTGGLVGGRVYEFYAKPSAGKTALALKIIAHFQKQQLLCAYFDVEEALYLGNDLNTSNWVENIGVDLSKLITPDFQSAEDAFRIAKTLIVSGVNLVVFDTVAVLQPSLLVDRGEESTKMNENLALSKLLKIQFNDLVGGFRAYRKKATGGEEILKMSDKRYDLLTKKYGMVLADRSYHKLKYYDAAFIGINHAKDSIGVMYGDTTYTPGGASLSFHSSIRIGMSDPIRSKEKVKDPNTGMEVPVFRKTRVTAAKNKLAAPFNEVTLKIYRDGRIEEDVVFWQEALKLGLVETTTQTVTIISNGEKLRKREFEVWATEHPEFFEGKLSEDKFEAVEEESDYDVAAPKSNSILKKLGRK